jgi:hypothetical protein
MPGGGTHAHCEPVKGHPGPWPGWAFATSNQPCAKRPNVLQPCTPRKACRCRQMPWPSCSATIAETSCEQRNDWLDRELSREYPMILQAWLTLPSCLASS